MKPRFTMIHEGSNLRCKSEEIKRAENLLAVFIHIPGSETA
jgi:hypothetical protein